MNKNLLKKPLPYIMALAIFLTITLVYFSPIFEGKMLKQHDIAMFKGMSQEIVDFRAKTGHEPLWTNSMFGGMPAWQISVDYAGNLMMSLDRIVRLGLPRPADLVFLYFLGFFILLLVLDVDPWLGIVGAIAFAMSSYFFIILGVGHTSKAHAIGYMAPVLAGIILTFRGKYWKGGLLTAIALALEILSGHLQITYYLLILVLVYGIYALINSLREKQFPRFMKASGVLVIAAIIAILTNITSLWGTYQYSKYSMRGKPVLTFEQDNKSGGLDRDYITAWSYGIGETWSLMIPDVKGGASGYIGMDNSAMDNVNPGFQRIIAQQNSYWGNQPGTAGPVYVGAIMVFLFVLGMFLIEDRMKWALFAATVLAIFLSWGKNFMGLTNFFIDYMPGYNKFRAVSMILVIAELTIPLLGVLALNKILKNPKLLLDKMKFFYIALGLTGGFSLLFYLMPTTFFSFFSQYELHQFNMLKLSNDPAQVTAFMDSLQNVRVAIFRQDTLRSLFFILASAVAMYAFVKGKLKKEWFLLMIGLLVLVDMTGVDQRYLNNSNFEMARKAEVPFSETTADRDIFKDKSLDYRVVDLTKDVFNDASTSYYHESIGGYHGAKLQRYQDLITYYLAPEIDNMRKVLSEKPTLESIDSALVKQQVVNMLNTKYLIYNPDAEPIYNTHAFGNAWLVNDYKLEKNADSTILALGKTDLHSVAVVDREFSNQLIGKKFPVDASAQIKLVSYEPNDLKYDFHSKAQQLVVFSEIYYPKGWNVYLDGGKVPYFRADYALRAMVVPAGIHTIEFKFQPKVWSIGETLSYIFSGLLLLLLIYVIVIEVRRFLKNKE
ncbi:MAG: YfhO family protein [Bacteroidales bacterium]|nr:YfhO family protein [Bacteroidales bacterium]